MKNMKEDLDRCLNTSLIIACQLHAEKKILFKIWPDLVITFPKM